MTWMIEGLERQRRRNAIGSRGGNVATILGSWLLFAVAAGCSGHKADAPGDHAMEVETGSITGATSAAIPCPPAHGPSNRKCFAVAHGPFVLTDLEAFAFPWYFTQTQGLQEAIAFPGPSGVPELPAGFAPRWQTHAAEYWSSGWQMQAGGSSNSGEPRIVRNSKAVHGARYLVGDREDLYISVLYRGCWKADVFERDACSPGSIPEISTTFSGYHGR